MTATDLLARLRDPSPGKPLDQLALLLVDDALARPLNELLPPAFLAQTLRAAFSGWVASEQSQPAIERALAELRETLEADERTLAEVMPPEVQNTAAKLLGRRFSPDRDLVVALLRPKPVRELIREILLEVLLDFGRKLRTPMVDNPVTKGLTGLARLAAEQARARAGALGALAGGVVGAVSEEVERQLERRTAEFLDATMSQVLDRLADELSHPSRAAHQSALRVALFESALGLTVSQLAKELETMDVPTGAVIVRESMTRWLGTSQSAKELEDAVRALMRRDGPRPLGELLGEHGLRESARTFGGELLRTRLRPVVESEPFAQWLTHWVQG